MASGDNHKKNTTAGDPSADVTAIGGGVEATHEERAGDREQGASPRPDAGELLAVNVLLEPDEAALEHARELNAELRRGLPGGLGFTFNETHLPHVTLLQRYVRRADLVCLLDTVGEVAVGVESGDLRLRAGDLSGGELGTPPGTVVASVEVEAQPAVRALHDSLRRALAPLAAPGGSTAAFFTLADERPPNPATVTYVREFVPAHSGDRYAPHLSVGVAREEDVRRLARAHPLRGTELRPAALAVAQLGDLGTARRVLGRWPLP